VWTRVGFRVRFKITWATVCQDTNGANAIFVAGQCSLDIFETEVSGPITGLRTMLEQAENKAGVSFSLPRLALHVTLFELLLGDGQSGQ
jgi:hypothetical protein